MAKEHDAERRGPDAAREPLSEPSGQARRDGGRPHPYPTVLDRINNLFGRLIGSSGGRHGARDTDPGN